MNYTKVPPFLEARFLCAVAYGANGQPPLVHLGVVELKFQQREHFRLAMQIYLLLTRNGRAL